MELPKDKMSPRKFSRVIRLYKKRHYTKEKEPKCKKCGAVILFVTATVSVHYKKFGDQCSGGGEVIQVQLPFCPRCESIPTRTSGCIHA